MSGREFLIGAAAVLGRGAAYFSSSGMSPASGYSARIALLLAVYSKPVSIANYQAVASLKLGFPPFPNLFRSDVLAGSWALNSCFETKIFRI